MTEIVMLGVDPAMRNFGMALARVDVATGRMTPFGLRLVTTEKTKNKKVRASSDNLAAAQALAREFREMEARATVIAAEIPSGAQSASGAYGLGLAVGVVGSARLPVIEVSPTQTKLAATGSKTASKAEMIAWAYESWPDLPWLLHAGKMVNANEHLADALAIVKAATLTPEFAQMAAAVSAMRKAA